MPDGVSEWFRQRPLPARMGIYAAMAMSAFLLSTAAGALGAVMLGDDSAWPGTHEPRPFDMGKEAPPSQDAPAPQDRNPATPGYVARERLLRGGDDAASTKTPLWEALRECERSQEECARDFVAGVAPGAGYAGGRIDTQDTGRTRYVLYFVDPDKAQCEYRRFESVGDGGSDYIVLVAGEGSFGRQQNGGNEAGCLPEL